MTLANSINSIFSNVDAFGNLTATTITPIVQLQFPYTINTDLVATTLVGSGTVTHSAPFAICSTTAAINSSATLTSKANLHYQVGQGGLCLFTAIFTTGVANSTQEVGLGDSVDGFFFGYNGETFGINRRSNTSNNYIAQSSWNKDRMDGTGNSKLTLDPTKGNVYKIQYQWLGFGAINFFIESQETGSFVLVHQIKYANQNTTTTVLNPSLPISVFSSNTSNDTNIVVKVPSIAAYVEGLIQDTGIINSINNAKSVTTQLNILTIKVNPTFNGIANKKLVKPRILSIANTSNADATFKLILNTTLGGAPSYTDISATTSVVSFDTAGTTITGGRVLMTFYVLGNNNTEIDLTPLPIGLEPSDILTISCASSGAALTASAAITWTEQF